MSNRKAYLVHFLAIILTLMGSSLAAPAFQRRDLNDPGASSLVDAADSLQKAVDDATPTMTPVITPTPMEGSPYDGTTTTTFTTVTSTLSSSVTPTITPTPTVTDTGFELVPPVTVIKQLGRTAVVAASQGTTTTIQIPASGLPSPTDNSNLVSKPASTSDGLALTVSSSIVAAGLAIAVWITF